MTRPTSLNSALLIGTQATVYIKLKASSQAGSAPSYHTFYKFRSNHKPRHSSSRKMSTADKIKEEKVKKEDALRNRIRKRASVEKDKASTSSSSSSSSTTLSAHSVAAAAAQDRRGRYDPRDDRRRGQPPPSDRRGGRGDPRDDRRRGPPPSGGGRRFRSRSRSPRRDHPRDHPRDHRRDMRDGPPRGGGFRGGNGGGFRGGNGGGRGGRGGPPPREHFRDHYHNRGNDPRNNRNGGFRGGGNGGGRPRRRSRDELSPPRKPFLEPEYLAEKMAREKMPSNWDLGPNGEKNMPLMPVAPDASMTGVGGGGGVPSILPGMYPPGMYPPGMYPPGMYPPGIPGMPGVRGIPGLAGVGTSTHQHATRHARRLYIGGLTNEHGSDSDLKEFFETTIRSCMSEEDCTKSVGQTGLIDKVYLNDLRGFAFLEFQSVLVCTACLALNGLKWKDVALKVSYPSPSLSLSLSLSLSVCLFLSVCFSPPLLLLSLLTLFVLFLFLLFLFSISFI